MLISTRAVQLSERCNLLTYKLMWEGVFRWCGLYADAAPKQAGAHEASGLDDNENAQALAEWYTPWHTHARFASLVSAR